MKILVEQIEAFGCPLKSNKANRSQIYRKDLSLTLTYLNYTRVMNIQCSTQFDVFSCKQIFIGYTHIQMFCIILAHCILIPVNNQGSAVNNVKSNVIVCFLFMIFIFDVAPTAVTQLS